MAPKLGICLAIRWLSPDLSAGVIATVFTCLIAMAAPALCTYFVWRYMLANFDRLVGRPHRPEHEPRRQIRARWSFGASSETATHAQM